MCCFLCGLLCFSITGSAHFCNIKRTDGDGLHRLIDEEEESSQEGQQQQLHPGERAAAHWCHLTSRRRWKHRLGGRRGVGGGGARHTGESISEAGLHVRGSFADVWREQEALLPQLPGFHWPICSSFDGSPTGGAAGRGTLNILHPCWRQHCYKSGLSCLSILVHRYCILHQLNFIIKFEYTHKWNLKLQCQLCLGALGWH